MIIKEGSIIPNVGIGSYLLDITKKELLDIIGNNYKETMRKRDSIISIENTKFWITEDRYASTCRLGCCLILYIYKVTERNA